MAGAQLDTFLRRLRRVLRPPVSEEASDAQLLQRFVQQRDEQAFELLVWRHGLMVLNVCRRVLRHEQDAEDAFQATFLALARKADAIGKRESLGSWLYKVAYRIALRARGKLPLRSLNEEPLPDPSSREPIDDLLSRELASVIDEEIQRLPEKYRTALVLCHLEGQTMESAARSLNCPPGTIGTWLARARTLLRRRLARRGFALSDVAGARNIVAVLSAALVHSTVQAALLRTAEQAAAAGVISASVAALTKGALQAMSLTRWTAITTMVLALSLLGGGSALLAHRLLAAEPAESATPSETRVKSAKERPPAAVSFQWKFQKGQPFYQVLTTKTTQNMKVMGNDVTQKQEETFYFRWTPEKRVDGQWIIAQKILGANMDIDIGGSPIKYDSIEAEDKSSNPLHHFFHALVGAEFKVFLDAQTNEIIRIDGREPFVKRLLAANKQMQPLLDKIVSENALKDMAEQSFARLLMGPARPGDSWMKRRQLDMGSIGIYQIKSRCTYVGRDGELDKINVDNTLQHGPAARRKDVGELPFDIEKASLHGKGTGVLLFDRVKGRLARAESSMNLEGTLTIHIGGQKTPVELSQTQQTTIETLDANPLDVKSLRQENDRLRGENERLRRRLHAVNEALRREDELKK
jgi:RNA polymerase sigma factor (sigma-70 family)